MTTFFQTHLLIRIALLWIPLLMTACSPRVRTQIHANTSYPTLDYQQEVTVIGIDEAVPSSAVKIGNVRIGDTGFSTRCGWDIVIERAKTEARKAGGNVVKIVEHTPPSLLGSSCDRITAEILRIEDRNQLESISTPLQPASADSSWNYAKLYVYRPKSYQGSLVGYDLYLGDSLLCRVTNNFKQEIHISKKGMNTLWAKTETRTEIPIDITFGREYYIRCSMGMGALVGRPQIQIIDASQAKPQYTSTQSR